MTAGSEKYVGPAAAPQIKVKATPAAQASVKVRAGAIIGLAGIELIVLSLKSNSKLLDLRSSVARMRIFEELGPLRASGGAAGAGRLPGRAANSEVAAVAAEGTWPAGSPAS